MTMHKYYTPELEEFHLGFRHEINHKVRDGSGNRSWREELYTGSTEPTRFIKFLIEKQPENIRVKYLDGDEIISLGFEIANDEGNTYKSLKRQLGMGTGDDKTLFIQHEVFSTVQGEGFRVNTHIWWRENRGDEITMFEGSIKNISELKRILRQIHADGITKK